MSYRFVLANTVFRHSNVKAECYYHCHYHHCCCIVIKSQQRLSSDRTERSSGPISPTRRLEAVQLNQTCKSQFVPSEFSLRFESQRVFQLSFQLKWHAMVAYIEKPIYAALSSHVEIKTMLDTHVAIITYLQLRRFCSFANCHSSCRSRKKQC